MTSFPLSTTTPGTKSKSPPTTNADPARRISSSILYRSGPTEADIRCDTTGDISVWAELPRYYSAFVFGDYRLLLVHPQGTIHSQTFPWFTSAAYDKDYQGIVGVEGLKSSGTVIVCIQRDSNPVVYDPERKIVIRKLTLADRRGNPEFQLRATAAEYWASDYDTIVKLDSARLNVVTSTRLQPAGEHSQQFIGDFRSPRADSICLVARPYSGDVIALDCATMTQTHRAALGRQPLDAALLADDKVIALDWKTGDFVSGSLAPI